MRSARKSLREIRAANGTLSEEDRTQALHTLSFIIKMADAWEVAYSLLLEMSPRMLQAGLCDEWIPYLQRGIEQSQVRADLRGRAELYHQLGTLYQRRGLFDFAFDCLTSSAESYREIEATTNYATVLNRLAAVARRQSRHDQAKDFVGAALPLLSEEDPEVANSYVVLGELAFDKRNWEEAEKYFVRALTIWEREEDERKRAIGLRNVGVSLSEQGKLQESIDCYRQALRLFKKCPDPINRAITQMNLGNAYLFSKHSTLAALDLYREAKSVFFRFHDNLHLAMVYNNLGYVYRRLERWDEAEAAICASINLWKRLGNVRQMLNSMDELGLILMGKGERLQAVDLFESALAELEKMRDHPGYDRLAELLKEHLDAASLIL